MFSVELVFSMLSRPHSDIRSCRQSAHVFTFRYDSTLLGHAFFTLNVFLDEIIYYPWRALDGRYGSDIHPCVGGTSLKALQSYLGL